MAAHDLQPSAPAILIILPAYRMRKAANPAQRLAFRCTPVDLPGL